VRQLRYIRKAKSRSATLYRMRTAENPIQYLIVRRLQIQVEQHLLHEIQILARFLEEYLIKLG
jgi:hypothetical protein